MITSYFYMKSKKTPVFLINMESRFLELEKKKKRQLVTVIIPATRKTILYRYTEVNSSLIKLCINHPSKY